MKGGFSFTCQQYQTQLSPTNSVDKIDVCFMFQQMLTMDTTTVVKTSEDEAVKRKIKRF